MFLVKSCYKPYNIKHGNLKLGTLHEYRHTEIEQIADKEEGTIVHNLKFENEVKISTKWFNMLNGGGMQFNSCAPIKLPGRMRARFEELHIIKIDDEFVTLENSFVTITREAPNSFVYCMSHIADPQECKGMFPDYDDYWHIPANQGEAFGIELGRVLLDTFKIQHLSGKYILPKETNLEKLRLHMRHGAVIYTPREINITNDSTFIFEQLMHELRDMAFIKPPTPFQKEKEYRFQYTILLDNKIIVPDVRSLILSAEKLQRFTY